MKDDYTHQYGWRCANCVKPSKSIPPDPRLPETKDGGDPRRPMRFLRRLRRSPNPVVATIGKKLQFYKATVTFWRHL